MRDVAYVLVFDGFADWEPALATAELNKSGRFTVRTVGFTPGPAVSMGGLRVTPDLPLSQVEPERAAVFILPGGDMWEAGPREELWPMLRGLERDEVPVAAICAATVEVVRAGLHRGRRHTSNGLEYLRSFVPAYDGEADYVPDLSACDRGLITASGAAPVEFARDILGTLDVYDASDLKAWFELFKYGVLPVGIG
ncbi:MAG TPA: type 1 glutamine amidotransferase family protein [Longimicrobium sp.]|jgi:putative intracellular protease/amidase